MMYRTIDVKKLTDSNRNLILKGQSNLDIIVSSVTILDRIFIEDCENIHIVGQKLLTVSPHDINSIPIITKDNRGLIAINDVCVINRHDTISVLLRSPCCLQNSRITGGSIGVHVDYPDTYVGRCTIRGQTSDGIFISSPDSTYVYSNHIMIKGSDADSGIHPDAIQLAGKQSNEFVQSNITIYDNNIHQGEHKDCQGIVHSDGMIINSKIEDNIIVTSNDNSIRVNRANSCTITNNTVSRDIFIGSTKPTDLESNSNTIILNKCRKLVTYNIGDSIVRGNEYEKFFNFGADGSFTYGVQPDD